MYKSFWQLVKLHTFPSPKHRGRGGRGEHRRRAEINPLVHRVYVFQCHFLYVMHVLAFDQQCNNNNNNNNDNDNVLIIIINVIIIIIIIIIIAM